MSCGLCEEFSEYPNYYFLSSSEQNTAALLSGILGAVLRVLLAVVDSHDFFLGITGYDLASWDHVRIFLRLRGGIDHLLVELWGSRVWVLVSSEF